VKPLTDRICYFARKANEYGARRFDYVRGRSDKQPPASRFERLLRYKHAMYAKIQAREDAVLC
jgi:hypothetical protein